MSVAVALSVVEGFAQRWAVDGEVVGRRTDGWRVPTNYKVFILFSRESCGGLFESLACPS